MEHGISTATQNYVFLKPTPAILPWPGMQEVKQCSSYQWVPLVPVVLFVFFLEAGKMGQGEGTNLLVIGAQGAPFYHDTRSQSGHI